MSMLALIFACFLPAVCEKRRGWLWFVLLVLLSVPLATLPDGQQLVGSR